MRATYTPWLAGYIRRMRVRQLQGISLAHVLSGDTCSPISLSEFEAYLAYTENALESLQFVVWFQDYTKRFFSLPSYVRALAPGPPDSVFERARSLRPIFIDRESSDPEEFPLCPQDPSIEATKAHMLQHILPRVEGHNPRTSVSEDESNLGDIDIGNRDSWTSSRTVVLPFRDECLHIVETFFRPGAVKQLKIDTSTRRTALLRLQRTSHPDAFLAAYEMVYRQLETQYLPNFIVMASTNVNVQKQMFWCSTGLMSLVIAISIFIALVVTVPDHRPANRAWRTFAVPFIWIALSQFYNAVTGLCHQVFSRGARQLRVWEMQNATPRFQKSYSSTPSTSNSPSSHKSFHKPHHPVMGTSESSLMQETYPGLVSGMRESRDLDLDDDTDSEDDADSKIGEDLDYLKRRNSSIPLMAHADFARLGTTRVESQDRNGYRPPIFGPERVVQDKRIQVVHARIVRTSLAFVACGTLLLCIPLYAIPGRKR